MIQVFLTIPPGVGIEAGELRKKIAESMSTGENNIQIIALTGGELSYEHKMASGIKFNPRGQIFAVVLGTDYALMLPRVPQKIRNALDAALGQNPEHDCRRLGTTYFVPTAFVPW